MKLDSVRGVAMEQGRLYRLVLNDKMKSAEAARMTYILREIRSSLEAVPPETPSQEPVHLNVITVPSGDFIRQLEASGNVIEHEPQPIPAFESSPPVETYRNIEPNITPRETLETKLAEMPREMLLKLAGVSDADD